MHFENAFFKMHFQNAFLKNEFWTMYFPKENERMTIYIPAYTLKSAARPQVCRSQVLVIKLSKLTRSKNDNWKQW